MARSRSHEAAWHSFVPGALIFLAFVAPGAWLIVGLPPVPIAKALNLLTVSIWLLAFGLGLVTWVRPERRVLWALVALLGSVLVSFLIGGSLFQVAFYDLYANMPLVQWLAFPITFVLAAGISHDRSQIESALGVVVLFGALLAGVEAFQQITTSTPRVFGSTGYSVAALAPLIPIGVVLAASRSGYTRIALYIAAALIALDVGLLAGSTMGTITVAFALLLAVAIHPAVWGSEARLLKALRWGAVGVASAMVLALLFAQVPALSGRWINTGTLGAGGESVASRLQMWQGAQQMLAEHPVFGFGPGGYRVAAVEFLPAEALQYGPDRQGSIDPTVYSPQSPHSLLWEAGTRLGLLGIATLLALFVLWGVDFVARARADTEGSATRRALGAGFLCAALALMVNPVYFAIGLFAPAMAGLAISPLAGPYARKGVSNERPRSFPLIAAAALLAFVSVWLGVGEWRIASVWSEDAMLLRESLRSTARLVPGHPQLERQLWELELILAPGHSEAKAVQTQVDAAPEYLRDFAPNTVSLAAYSLSQAERSGRTDLSWERSTLDEAADRLPPIPSLVAEQLRLEVLSGDRRGVESAVVQAEQWGAPYPLTESYLQRARELLAQD